MMLRKIAVLALGLALAAVAAEAQTFVYEDDGEPLFSVRFPSGWLLDLDFSQEAREAGTYREGEELEIRIVEARPADGRHIWLGVWAIPESPTIEEGLEYLTNLRGTLFTDLEISEPVVKTLNGMDARMFSGTATYEGETVELGMALFAPGDSNVAAILYVGEAEAWAAYRDELEGIVGSLRPAN